MIYDSDDKLSSDEAASFVNSYSMGGWTVAAEGIRAALDLSTALDKFVNIEQLSFCTHGFPGGVYFPGGSITETNLRSITVPPSLFNGPGRLLFMGCETASGKGGTDFLIAAGKHFFAGRGGIVGGSTIYNLGFSSGTRLPIFGSSSAGWNFGNLILYKIDPSGKVVDSKTVRPFGV